MMREDLPPFLVRPRYVQKPWGGRRLQTVLGRRDLPSGLIGESWEVGDVEGWEPVIDGGPLGGKKLRNVWGEPFPLLLKVLDARENLSVQVHPDGRDGVPAKEEAWVALADGGTVAVGAVDAHDLPAPGGWLERLDKVPLYAASHDAGPTLVHVPAGTVHAILAGSFVWEVQTPVDVTWRLDDFGRMGLDGRPRELHLQRARAVLERGPEDSGRVAEGGRGLLGTRLGVHTHGPGTWSRPPGCAIFCPAGARVESSVHMLRVPPGRTAVLTPSVTTVESEGWMFSAGPA